MNGYREYLLVTLGVFVAIAIVLNDLLFMLANSGEFTSTGHITHMVALVSMVAYIFYLKRELFTAKHKLAAYRCAWRQIRCGIAIFKNDTLVEVGGDAEIFRIFGFSTNKDDSSPGKPQPVAGRMIRTEECSTLTGRRQYADRFVIPLAGFNAGSYVAEMLLEASERVTSENHRENEYVTMLKILVNMFEIKDPYSQGHSEVVSNLAQELARALKLPEAEISTIGKAALLHDIGKIIIPSEIVNKTVELSALEFESIQAHANVGADILAGMNLFKKEAVIVRHHHERYDGKGYPARLHGSAIPLGSRIIAVADTFEAMAAGRSARGKRDVAAILTIMEGEKGRQFDPEIVDAFINLVKVERGKQE